VNTFDPAVWTTAKSRLRDRLGSARTLEWLEDVALVRIDRARGRAILEAPNQTQAIRAREHLSAIEAELATAASLPRVTARLVYAKPWPRAAEKRAPRAAAALRLVREKPEEPETPTLGNVPSVRFETFIADPRLRLANFMVGPANELAHRFAREVVERPASYVNPFLIHGDTGTGKSHILHAIANAYVERHPGRKVVLASSERFATQFSLAVRGGQAPRFRELYREADLLLLDDVQQLAGKAETEKELVHTIDELERRGHQVVLASSLGPKRLPRIDPGLEGRLLQGVVVEVKALDEGTRERLLRAKAAALRLDLDDATARALARRFQRADQVLGALKRLDAHSRLLGRTLTPREVEGALGELLGGRDESPSPSAIAEFVGRALDVDPAAIRGKSRKPSVVQARQLAMALTRRLTPLTLREIGAHFGNRSCACVHFAHGKVKLLREGDARIKPIFDEALSRFGSNRRAR
jgi:chromosomal replication initiator protein